MHTHNHTQTLPHARTRARTRAPTRNEPFELEICVPHLTNEKRTSPSPPQQHLHLHLQVHKWIGSVVAQGGADLTFFTRRRWYDQGWKPQLRDRRERTNHVWQLRRPLNMSGMTNDQDVPRTFDVEAETTTGSAFTRAVRESKPRKVKMREASIVPGLA